MIHQDYIPMSRIFFYDVVDIEELPVILVTYNKIKMPIDLTNYPNNELSQMNSSEKVMNFNYCFVDSISNL